MMVRRGYARDERGGDRILIGFMAQQNVEIAPTPAAPVFILGNSTVYIARPQYRRTGG